MGDCSSCRRRHWVLMTCSEPKSPLSDRPVTTPDWCNYYEPRGLGTSPSAGQPAPACASPETNHNA
jgi:hypothetical protein